jgi:hypothetical protein
MGTPMGGDPEYDPPRYVSSVPLPNAVNYRKQKIEITFDELINIEKPMEKVIITPPQKKPPDIKSSGKKVIVELKDTLKPNTTYTFDFTDGIVDNNEKNVLESFSFAFSTGDVVDSLVMSGLLLNAQNLEPMPNIMIGLHSDMDDSAFVTIPFVRTTKTNDRGMFWVRNVAEGAYHVFALNDVNRDYHFDQPGEEIAFLDSIFIPSFEPAIRMDTLWQDSLTIDTICEVHYNRFTPDNIRLLLFKEKFERQYLSKTERMPFALKLQFNSADSLQPVISVLNIDVQEDDWAIPEYSEGGKTIQLWLKDSLLYKADTLSLEIDYLKTDTLNRLVQTKDTVVLALRKTPAKKSKGKDKQEPEIEFLTITSNQQSVMDVYDTLRLTFAEPLLDFDPNVVRFEQKVDTLWEPRELQLEQDSLNPRQYALKQKWTYEAEYRMTVDSAAITSIYGKWNNKYEATFKFRKNSDYGHLYVAVAGNSTDGFGELLDGSDKPVRTSVLKNGELLFFNLKPGKYYLRFIEDSNGNGKWDTGNYAEKLPPETVYYYPAVFEIKQNFEFEQSWDLHETPIEKQKPLEITKNKPAEKRQKRDAASGTQRDGSRNTNMNLNRNANFRTN